MSEPVETNELFLSQIKRHEGLRLEAYVCSAGALTIGYGHNLEAQPIKGLGAKSEITPEEANSILVRDCRSFAKQLDKSLQGWRDLCLPRQAVLLNMAFNLGVPGLLGFRRMLDAVGRGHWHTAHDEMLGSKWAGQVGRRAVELANQMQTGFWQSGV